MAKIVTIPKLDYEGSVWADYPVVGKPGWIPTQGQDGKPRKPLIRCNCGSISGIGLHHVHADGRVTASFYHKRGNTYPEDPKGCEWHVYLKLSDWIGEEFPPEPKR